LRGNLKIRHVKSEILLGREIKEAKSFRDRLVGLMFKNKMKEFDGLMITPCKSIHTFFMKFNIDVVFLDKKFLIVKILRDMKPWRVSGFYMNALHTLELPSGTLTGEVQEGDELEVVNV